MNLDDYDWTNYVNYINIFYFNRIFSINKLIINLSSLCKMINLN